MYTSSTLVRRCGPEAANCESGLSAATDQRNLNSCSMRALPFAKRKLIAAQMRAGNSSQVATEPLERIRPVMEIRALDWKLVAAALLDEADHPIDIGADEGTRPVGPQ